MIRIAIIDDNSTVLLITETLLKSNGFVKNTDEIITYLNVDFPDEEMLMIINNTDIVICDNDLGEGHLQGFDFLKRLSYFNYRGLMILMTGDESYNMRAKLEGQKNIHYVIKNNENGESSTISQIGRLITQYKNNGMLNNA